MGVCPAVERMAVAPIGQHGALTVANVGPMRMGTPSGTSLLIGREFEFRPGWLAAPAAVVIGAAAVVIGAAAVVIGTIAIGAITIADTAIVAAAFVAAFVGAAAVVIGVATAAVPAVAVAVTVAG